MSTKNLELLFEEKKYKEIIAVYNLRLDNFEKLTLDDFILWSRCYEEQGDFESALYILSLCYIEEIDDKVLDKEYERLTNLQDRVFQAVLQLKSGLQDSDDVDFLITTLQSLIKFNIEDVLVALMEDIFRVTKNNSIRNIWLGECAEKVFFDLNEQLILTSNQREAILDAIIYYYISTSKVYDGRYSYINSIRNKSA